MRRKQNKNSAWVLVLLMLGSLTFAFQFGAVAAWAQDADSDGFTDALENNPNGIPLINGLTLEATGQPVIPKCTTGLREQCIDPQKQDYFVIIKRATTPCPASTSCGDQCGPPMFNNATTNIAPYAQYVDIYGSTLGPLQWVSGIQSGFSTHTLLQNPNNTGQQVTTGGWYAVKIVEDLNPCSSWMGLSTPGTITPAAPGSATVWPEKIMNWVDKACSQACFTDKNGVTTCYYVPVPGVTVPAGYVLQAPGTGTFTCKNANNTTYQVNMKDSANNFPNLPRLYHDFIKNIISHEASHMMHLAFGSGTSADNHWPQASGTLMEQFINTKATKDRNDNITVTLYISNSFANQDPAQHKLK